MKIAVISDVHGNIEGLDAVYKDIKKQGADSIVFLGDLIMTGPRPQESFDLMEEIDPDIWIKGNTDEWVAEIPDFVPSNDQENLIKEMGMWALERFREEKHEKILDHPISQNTEYENLKIHFCHGTPSIVGRAFMPESEPSFLDAEFEKTDAQIIICGHSHLRFSMIYKNHTVKNFGAVSMHNSSLTRAARYGMITTGKTVSFEDRECSYDFDKFINDMKTLEYPGRSFVFDKYGL